MKTGDKVKSSLSLWSGDIGTITGIVDVEGKDYKWVHVIFPETDKHYSYQQSFSSKDLILI